MPYLPLTSWHANHRSSGIPTAFPLQTNALTVDKVAQSTRRGLRNINTGTEPLSGGGLQHQQRGAQSGRDHRQRRARRRGRRLQDPHLHDRDGRASCSYLLGTQSEKSEDILKRMANDKASLDFNPAQLEGRYFFAQTEAQVAPAFQDIQNQILRLSK